MKENKKIDDEKLSEIVKKAVNRIVEEKEETIDIPSVFNIYSIPEEELRSQYVDLSFVVSSTGYGGKFMGANGKIISESATSTMDIVETKKMMKQKFNLKDWQIGELYGANGIRLVVLYPGIFKNTRAIKKAMESCGWSLATKGMIVMNKMVWKAMSFDPMFQDDVSTEARRYGTLYHWTPKYNYNSISEHGLMPRSENRLFDYPNRLHLIKGNTPLFEIMDIGKQLCEVNSRFKNNGDYMLLSVDLTKVPSDTEIFYDPRYEWGYYTKTGIPKEALSIAYEHNFKKDKKK